MSTIVKTTPRLEMSTSEIKPVVLKNDTRCQSLKYSTICRNNPGSFRAKFGSLFTSGALSFARLIFFSSLHLCGPPTLQTALPRESASNWRPLGEDNLSRWPVATHALVCAREFGLKDVARWTPMNSRRLHNEPQSDHDHLLGRTSSLE